MPHVHTPFKYEKMSEPARVLGTPASAVTKHTCTLAPIHGQMSSTIIALHTEIDIHEDLRNSKPVVYSISSQAIVTQIEKDGTQTIQWQPVVAPPICYIPLNPCSTVSHKKEQSSFSQKYEKSGLNALPLPLCCLLFKSEIVHVPSPFWSYIRLIDDVACDSSALYVSSAFLRESLISWTTSGENP